MSDEEASQYRLWRVFCRDGRGRVPDSLISNGLINVSLIDSPGLNRDLAKTMSIFARQSEIDAVVFVVNAENHFTLSVSLHYHITNQSIITNEFRVLGRFL
jgi:mitofusin